MAMATATTTAIPLCDVEEQSSVEGFTGTKPLELSVAGAIPNYCFFDWKLLYVSSTACCSGDLQSLNSFAFQYVLLLMTFLMMSAGC